MMRAFLIALAAVVLGFATAEYLTTFFSFRHWIGRVVRRGELQAMVGRTGIYDTDVERAWRGELFAIGADAQGVEISTAAEQKRSALQHLVEGRNLSAQASGTTIESAWVGHDLSLLRAQFPDEKTWKSALTSAATTRRALEREVARALRDRVWLENAIESELQPNEKEARQYFDEHRAGFQEPLCLRASHLFLAAPDGYPKEVIEAKGALIAELSKRLARSESFPALVAAFSEDEATKARGGDLGYFAEERMLPEVFAAAQQLGPGETSAPVRSRLGFHIIRLMESRPPRARTFEEVRPEIEALLTNQRRAKAVAAAVAAL